MLFAFRDHIQAGIDAGQYEVVKNAAGEPLGLARDIVTKRFVGQAIGILDADSLPLNPVAIQTGLKSLQASLGVLQTMTALTGVGVVANLAVSAVSLWQLLKLRDEVKAQRVEIKEGFLDLKRAMQDQGIEGIQKIDEAVQAIDFRQQYQALAQAYSRFLEATRLMQLAMSCEDLSIRNADLANARQTLRESLADYKSPHLLPEADVVTQLRRAECVWTIEYTIAMTYQLQNQSEAVSHGLGQLQARIRQDIGKTLDHCESEDELDIIYPEITRIYDQDLALLQLWQDQIDWARSLPSTEQPLLQEANINLLGMVEQPSPAALEIPSEQLLYETLKEKSHFSALCDSLRMMVQPEARQNYEAYVIQQAEQAGHRVLTAGNLQQMTDVSVANLYWYFQVQDESEQELEDEEDEE